jgi:diaminohydroxyphosphoribosylaminopyrimidine deaminase / 5-amino-6-(5-phosphoribosylamino)uracil reductase
VFSVGSVDDRDLMLRALAAAHLARRHVAPWPHVGAALLTGSGVVSAATGPYPIGPHAEVAALGLVADARGATLATTLEPCDHHGNTPPCTAAILAAGVRRVVVGVLDPDPKVAGRGVARLRAAGVEVDVGVEAHAVECQLGAYLHHRRTGRARCVLKVATSLDGRIAASDGSSRWITGPSARADSHELRADCQAIVVGSGTAIADDPSLTVRDAEPPLPLRSPLRVLLDARGRVPVGGRLADLALAPTLVVLTQRAPTDVARAWRDVGADVEYVGHVEGAQGSGVDLHAVLDLLGGRGVLQAMVEGGAYLHGALLAEGLADRIVAYIGNTLLGSTGLAAYGLPGIATIADAPRWRLIEARPLGDDVRLEYARTGEF